MNPYDFVRIDWDQPIVRRTPAPHDRFVAGGLCGRIDGTITALTPLFIPATADLQQKEALARANKPIIFAQNRAGHPIIPGSSLKGLFRSMVELLGPGCWWLFDGRYRSRDGRNVVDSDYSQRLPQPFRQCSRGDQLCVACRLFGLIRGRTLLLGKVGFEDAVCDEAAAHPPIYTPILDTPKARHEAWYLSADRRRVAGRKLYFHFPPEQIIQEIGPRVAGGGRMLNSYIKPLGAGSRFRFSASFSNVAADEWPVLLYALALERSDWGHQRDLRHKLGYAKPAGLGSAAVELTRLTLVDYARRYSGAGGGTTTYEGQALHDYVNNQIQARFLGASTPTLVDLRRIWGWPPPTGVTYHYPPASWFDEHPNDPLSQAP